MNRKSDLYRSDSKLRAPAVKFNRASLQAENFSKRRSSSLDARNRNSGSLVKPRSSSDERKSIFNNGASGGRKSSLSLNEKKIGKDPRPLTDKAYQKQKAKELIEYLNEIEFKYPMNLNKLTQPSKKDFENMFEHLITCLEPNFTTKKIEEDAPRILSNLLYKFTVNRTAFQYVARTSWPPLLGVLLFLMDLGKVVAKLDFNEVLLQNGEYESKRELQDFLMYVRMSYGDKEEEVDNEKEEEIFTAIIKAHYPCELEELNLKYAEVEAELNATEEVVKRIQNDMLLVKEQEHEIETYNAFFPQMENHMAKKVEEYERKQKIFEETERRWTEMKRSLSEKRSAYDAQGFDGRKKMSYFMENKEELVRTLARKRTELAELRDRHWETELKMSKDEDKISAASEAFNELLERLESDNACAEVSECGVSLHLQEVVPRKCPAPERKAALQEARRRVGDAHCKLAGVAASQEQRLQEILTENTNLQLQINAASVHEKGREMSSEEKKLQEENSEFEFDINQEIRQLKKLQDERDSLGKESEDLKAELKDGLTVKTEMEKVRDDVLRNQSELFQMYASEIEKIRKIILESGRKRNEIVKNLLKTASDYERSLK